MLNQIRRRHPSSGSGVFTHIHPPENGASGATPAESIDRNQLLEIVRSFFRELSDRQREVFDLVDLQGYRPTEAAEMLGIDAATARTHLLRARRTIRGRILDHYPELLEGAG